MTTKSTNVCLTYARKVAASSVLVISGIMVPTVPLWSQEHLEEAVQSKDAIIEALYGSISGEKGQARDWDLFRHLFIEEAQLMPTGTNAEGDKVYRIISPVEFVESANESFMENGFFEEEIFRVEETYGPVTHIFSTYISKRSESDPEPFNRGINSIQLFDDGNRWWIVSVYWSHESAANPLPAKYLPE